MRALFLSFLFFSSFSLSAVNSHKLKSIINIDPTDKNCSDKNLVLKTKRTEKDRKFAFWKLRHKKIIIVDRILDSNGKTIFKKSSVHICSMDACDTRKFRRLKIIGNEIWLFCYNKNLEKPVIKRYDFCGKYLDQRNWDDDKSFEDY